MFRDLKTSEVECRIAQVFNKQGEPIGLTLLLYKTARTDMDILDETIGNMNWRCDYKEIKGNMYCGISILNEKTNEWIEKWDCGAESYSDKEKGEASDAFKRAGFKWGIGRELYTSPFIWITPDKCKIEKKGDKFVCKDKFFVEAMEIKDKEITGLAIRNEKTNTRVFVFKKGEK